MDTPSLPVEGWVGGCASYTTSIVRSTVTALRDSGPLSASQALSVIKQAGIGADVAKASPILDVEDGARRILNLILSDIDEIEDGDDGLSVPISVSTVKSTITNTIFELPPADELAVQREENKRQVHLRRWLMSYPFANVWRDGIRTHSDEEIVAMADYISTVGYVGEPIVRDQNGVLLNGVLRFAALTKLGVDPEQYTSHLSFRSDLHRLAWIINVHHQDGRWPKSLREAIVKVVNAPCRNTGVKVIWPRDIPLIVGNQDAPLPAIEKQKRERKAPAVQIPAAFLGQDPAPKTPPPLRGTQIRSVMLRMLNEDRPMTMDELGIKSSSVFYRAIKKGWMVQVGTRTYFLTEAGRYVAENLKRDAMLDHPFAR